MNANQPVSLTTENLRDSFSSLHVGQSVLLSGTVYTARDAAHKRLCALLAENKPLPIELAGAVLYYAGPTPTKPDGQIGAFGPTTATRMDAFAPVLMQNGMAAMIGKGNRNENVCEAIRKNNAAYFCACGGLGALISRCITACEEIAFPELGCESIKKLTVCDMPLIAAILPNGENIFNK